MVIITDRRLTLVKFAAFVAALAALWWLGRFFHIDTAYVRVLLKPYPAWLVGFIFVALYVIVTFFVWLSKDIFRLVAAVVFGPYVSTLLVWIAECINAFILFSLSRIFGRGFIAASLAGRMKRLDTRLGTMPLGWLMLVRFVPLFAFRFMDIAAGVSSIRLRRYMAAVVLATPLRVLWLQVVLAAVGESAFDPIILARYLQANPHLVAVTFAYMVLMCIVAAKLKKKGYGDVRTD
jgi:uncharacterized membrane protein YdjX (TVP38/TMEM64 family)